jgi:23S rRNA (uracil1939-C5)-methyltransferase
VASAIYDAGENAKINSVADVADFYCGKAEALLRDDPEIDAGVKDFLVGDDLVIVDPPRDGLHPKVIEFLIELKQQHNFRLLYISCNPTTLARDLELFLQGGYHLMSGIQAVDMFPQTHHVECITILK